MYSVLKHTRISTRNNTQKQVSNLEESEIQNMIGDDEEVMLDQSLDSPTRRVQPVVRVQAKWRYRSKYYHDGDDDNYDTSNTTPSTTTITTTTPTRRTPASMVPPSSARHRRVLNRGSHRRSSRPGPASNRDRSIAQKFVILWK